MTGNKVMLETKFRWTPRMQFKSFFQYLFPIFLISYIIFMAAWDVGAENLNKSGDRLHQVVLQLPWLNQFQFAGYYAAIEKGYYKDAGFKVNTKEGKPGVSPVEEVISGRVNYGVARSEILLHYLHGRPIVVLAAIMQHSAIILLTKKESGISSPHDMIGHRVMMLTGDDAAEYIAMFRNEGISLEQIKVIPSSYDINDLIEGKIDAFNAYSTNEPYYLEANNIPSISISPINYGIDFYGDCLFTSEIELKRNPEQVRAFREASLRGWEYAMAHPEEIVNIILTKYGTKKTREHLSFEANSLRKLILPDLIQMGHMNPGRWNHMAKTYVELGMVDPEYSLEDFIYDPNPMPDNTWIRWTFGVTAFLGLLIGLSSIFLLFHNRKLQVEVKQRRQAEDVLRLSEDKLRATLDATPFPMAVVDLKDDKIVYWSRSAEKLFGHTAPTTSEWYQIAYPDPDYRQDVIERWKPFLGKARESGQPINTGEYRVTCSKGSERICELYATFLPDNLIVTFNDITDRKQAEEGLKEKTDFLDKIIESAALSTWISDEKGTAIRVNPACLEFFGATEDEVIGKYNLFQDVVIEKNGFMPDIREVFEKGKPANIFIDYDFGAVDHVNVKNATHKTINSIFTPIKDATGKVSNVIVQTIDLTDIKRMEEQLIQSRKMESIGNLAGGIAHEFNNILSIIIGNNELVMEELPEWGLARESAEEIRIAGMRARDVVKQLLTFSRKDNSAKKVMNIKSVVHESMKLIRSSTPANIEIQQTLSDDVYPVLGNATQINQLLINICNNAIDAMPNTGGILTVDLSNETVEKKYAERHPKLKPGRYVKMVVSDNGSGMEKEILDKIFEPYYTTKEIGKGTGIGLAVVHGIIERHGGSIIVDSQLGQGTTFSIFLPAHDDLVEQEFDEKIFLPTGDECILYVDDEPSIAKLGKRHLENLGYTAESTTDPLKALEMVKTDPDKFDLVISDMAMPDMTGDQLVVEILKLCPDMPTIICTGYSAKISEKEAAKIGVCSFVMKPLDKSEFAKTIRKVLDEAKDSAHA